MRKPPRKTTLDIGLRADRSARFKPLDSVVSDLSSRVHDDEAQWVVAGFGPEMSLPAFRDRVAADYAVSERGNRHVATAGGVEAFLDRVMAGLVAPCAERLRQRDMWSRLFSGDGVTDEEIGSVGLL